ncbi:hypothetical protein [Bradyrhizobium niftali]|jgi:hypothetical protein|uniref:hypothetical protein n=1 Tax=Bradyrhizobium niftali TaxID=2560055 RepID=UPI001F35C254|nr:hypothetical protein [Bradyrhizobium niftali]
MVAQDMRDIGVCLAEADDEGEEIADRAACGGDGQPQGTEAGAANEVDDLERQHAVALAPSAIWFSNASRSGEPVLSSSDVVEEGQKQSCS